MYVFPGTRDRHDSRVVDFGVNSYSPIASTYECHNYYSIHSIALWGELVKTPPLKSHC